MSENPSLPQSQTAASQSGSLAVSGQFVVAPLQPAWDTAPAISELHSDSASTETGSVEHLPVAPATEDPILLTNLVGTIRGLIFSTFGSDISGDEMARKYNIIRALRKDASQTTDRILLDDSSAKPSDTIH